MRVTAQPLPSVGSWRSSSEKRALGGRLPASPRASPGREVIARLGPRLPRPSGPWGRWHLLEGLPSARPPSPRHSHATSQRSPPLASTQRGSPTTAVRQGERRRGRADACLHCSRTTSQQAHSQVHTAAPCSQATRPAHSRDVSPRVSFRSPHPIHGAGGRRGWLSAPTPTLGRAQAGPAKFSAP